MRPFTKFTATLALLGCCLLLSTTARATDVDGVADCFRTLIEYGDAPEGVQAYPGILAAFPTRNAADPSACRTWRQAPISTMPGPAGFVRHQRAATDPGFWLGCFPATGGGVDIEPDGKTNDNGAAVSACNPNVAVDCYETAFGLTFGQDEAYGTNDAGLAAAVTFGTCASSTVTFNATNCAGAVRQVFLNILVDWNQDGDWNDNFQCPGACAYEWAVVNQPVFLQPGCNVVTSPAFRSGPNAGDGWMRITLTNAPVNMDFPWAGSATVAGMAFQNGETEDYPVTIGDPHSDCPDYEDWGDAPEEATAYSNGVIGRFPTCLYLTPPGTQELSCPPISTPPGQTGHVKHVSGPFDPKIWFGCGDATSGTSGVDGEPNGKMNPTGALVSQCDGVTTVDCAEPAFTLTFGQDECYGDPPFDAGLRSPVSFSTCTPTQIRYYARNCDPLEQTTGYLNILVDWNQDGDWNDNFLCGVIGQPGACAYEWAVKNQLVVLPRAR